MAGEMRANVPFKDSMFHDHTVKFWGTKVSVQEDSAPPS